MAAVLMESILWHTTGGVPYDVGAQYPLDDEVHRVGEVSLIETLETLQFAKRVPSIVATGATAGTPGTFTPEGAVAPADLAALTGLTATPATAWTTGQHVILGDTSHASWNATAWVAGDAP